MLYGILFRMPSCRFMANGRSEWECRGLPANDTGEAEAYGRPVPS
jgi:hypothetical protein